MEYVVSMRLCLLSYLSPTPSGPKLRMLEIARPPFKTVPVHDMYPKSFNLSIRMGGGTIARSCPFDIKLKQRDRKHLTNLQMMLLSTQVAFYTA